MPDAKRPYPATVIDAMDPVDVLDYCSNGCLPDGEPITVWNGETCTCCGGEWGYGPEVASGCRGVHITGWNVAVEYRDSSGQTPPPWTGKDSS